MEKLIIKNQAAAKAAGVIANSDYLSANMSEVTPGIWEIADQPSEDETSEFIWNLQEALFEAGIKSGSYEFAANNENLK